MTNQCQISVNACSTGFSDHAAKAAQRETRTGLIQGLAAYAWWGSLAPIFFRQLREVSAFELLAERVVWCAVTAAILITCLKRWDQVLGALRSKTTICWLLGSSACIAVNWLVFMHAVVSGHLKEASLGYFINPLVAIALGVIFLGERMSAKQWACISLAVIGVCVRAVSMGSLPWISLTVAFSFGLYGLLRKQAAPGPIVGLALENAILTPISLAYLFYLGEAVAFGDSTRTSLLLILSGPITAVPLLLFGAATKRLRLGTIGLLQYIAPTLQFLIAVFMVGEGFNKSDAWSFGFIWLGVILFVAESVRSARTTPTECVAIPE